MFGFVLRRNLTAGQCDLVPRPRGSVRVRAADFPPRPYLVDGSFSEARARQTTRPPVYPKAALSEAAERELNQAVMAAPMPASEGSTIAMPAPTTAVRGAATAGEARNLCTAHAPASRPANIGPAPPHTQTPAPDHPSVSAAPIIRGSTGGRRDATLALGVVPDLLDESLMRLDAELDHDVDEKVQEALDIVARQLPARPGFASRAAPTARTPIRRWLRARW